MDQNKNNYETPKVKIVSFQIERGFGGTVAIQPSDQESATQQLEEQNDHWVF